jgi:YegS/Rv2252/BmrU family lipid kinase
MINLLLIINPAAGRSKRKSYVFQVADWFRRKGCSVSVFSTTKSGDAAKFVEQYASENDIIVCCGGDGTLNEVITGSMKLAERKPIGYLPAGTTNDMAKTLHLPTNIRKAAHAVLSEKPIFQDVGAFNKTKYFTYIASFGAFTKVSYSTPQWLKNRLGHLAYVLDGIRSVGEIRPYHLKAESRDSVWTGNFIFGSISNSRSIGGVLELKSSDVSLNDGKFEVLLIREPKNFIEFQAILHDLYHHNFQNKHIVFFHTDRIRLEFDQPTDWTLDGEYAGNPQTAEISNIHDAVRLIHRQ